MVLHFEIYVSLTFMYTDIDEIIGRRIRTYQYDDENERCSVSSRNLQRKGFSGFVTN